MKKLRVGLLGLGTVGKSVVEILSQNQPWIAERAGASLEIVRALVRQTRKRRDGAASKIPTTNHAQDILEADDIDLVVEVMGGLEPAFGYITQALQKGKPVVTANKAVLAAHGQEIAKLVQQCNTAIYYEAAVAGGVPIIRTLRHGLISDRILRLRGILNGTTNFILGLMEKGEAYDTALKQAQKQGYAEADPTLDINGADARDKLAILIQLAFGLDVHPSDIPTEGIGSLTPEVLADARQLGYRVKLLAIAKRVGNKLEARVQPAFVPFEHHFSAVFGIENAISVDSDALGTTLYVGPGAGGMPTASAVVSDLIEAAQQHAAKIFTPVRSKRSALKLALPETSTSAFYVRFLVEDRPGVLAAITRILASNHVSLAAVLQHERGLDDEPVALVILTHPTTHGAMNKALNKIKQLPILHGGLSVVPIEEQRVTKVES
jgi:homoserine dehydrogenase